MLNYEEIRKEKNGRRNRWDENERRNMNGWE